MSSNLVKGGYVIVAKNEAVKIDSNETIAKKLEQLSLQKINEHTAEDGENEGFVEGIDPFQVAQLVDEGVHQEAQIREEVRMQEEEIVKSANEEAQKILNEANQNAAQIASQARESARQEGFESGYNEGMKSAYDEVTQKEKSLQEEYDTKKFQLENDYNQRIEKMEPDLVQVLTDIYSHVIGVELESKKDTILFLLKRSIADMDSSNKYMIHVSHNDVQLVRDAKESIAIAGGIAIDNLEIIEDNTLEENGCLIESDGGIFDCGLGTQMELLKKQLRLLSFQKE